MHRLRGATLPSCSALQKITFAFVGLSPRNGGIQTFHRLNGGRWGLAPAGEDLDGIPRFAEGAALILIPYWANMQRKVRYKLECLMHET